MTDKKDDFRPIPFYFVNDTVVKEEVELQMRKMQESGVSGFFLHARCGLNETGYGNKKWYDDVEYIIQRAAAYGLDVWLYDEDAYPSGNAGGRIAMEHPEYVAQALRVKKLPVEKGKCSVVLGVCRPLRAYAIVRKGEELEVTDLTEHFGVVREQWYGKEDGYVYFMGVPSAKHIRSAAYNPQTSFYCENVPEGAEVYVAFTTRCNVPNRFGSLVDNINKDCVDLFKKYAYESYFEHLSKEALSNVRGTFTDEPVAGGMPPWTGSFESNFLAAKGYAIEENYFHLADDFSPRSATVRRDYWQVASKMFLENYVKNLHAFCKEKGIDLVGHFESEEMPYYQSLKCVNVYGALWQLDHSGFDYISSYVASREDVRLSFGAKLASSVSVQKGNQRTLCEIWGVNPFNFNLDGMKRTAGWAMTLGADTLVPHAFYYGYAGLRKYDAGKSFFFQDPNFSEFARLSKFVDGIAKRMHERESASNTLLVYPNWEFAGCSFLGEEKYHLLANKFFEVFKSLLDLHVEFEITDCEYIAEHFTDGVAKVGVKQYDNIVYVTDGSSVMAEIWQKINATDARVFDCSNGVCAEELLKYAFHTPLKTVKGDCREVNVAHRIGQEGEVVLLYNASKRNNAVSLATEKHAYVYDAETDLYASVENTDGEITLSLEGYSLTCLILRENALQTNACYEAKEYADKTYEYEKNPEWTYRPPVDLKGIITHFDVTVKGKSREEQYLGVKPCKVEKVFGVDARERLSRVARPLYDDAGVATEYPVEASYKATFQAKSAKKLLFEESTFTGECAVYLNGKQLDKSSFIKERVYDFRNLTCEIAHAVQDGENVLEIKFPRASANDGLTGEIYLI